MQKAIIKYKVEALGEVDVPTKQFVKGRIVDGLTIKKKAFLVTNPGRNSAIVYEEDLKRMGVNPDKLELIDEDGVTVSEQSVKRTYKRRK